MFTRTSTFSICENSLGSFYTAFTLIHVYGSQIARSRLVLQIALTQNLLSETKTNDQIAFCATNLIGQSSRTTLEMRGGEIRTVEPCSGKTSSSPPLIKSVCENYHLA